MPMTSYEVVKAAIHHQGPDRLPALFGCFGCDDRAWVPVQGVRCRSRDQQSDEWGCIWDQTEMKNMGQVVGHPFADGIPDDLSRTAFPDYNDDRRYLAVEAALQANEAAGKYCNAGLFMVLFERVHSLMGFENAMMALVDEDEQPDLRRLIEHIVDVHLCFVDNLDRRFPGRIHSISMTDDFGTQQAAYVSADFWMEFFYPYYKRLFDRMHAAGYDVWVHSCGKVNEIVECYIAAGADVVNLQQPRALGIEEMGRRYRGRIAFESLADIQATLPTGDPARIEADAEALMTHWASPAGGFLFSDYGDGEAIGTPYATKEVMYRAFSRWSERIYGRPLPEPTVPVAELAS